MKKIIIIICAFFVLLFSTQIIFLLNFNNKTKNQYNLVDKNMIGLESIPMNKNIYRGDVFENEKATSISSFFSYINKIGTYSLNVKNNTTFASNQILSRGSKVVLDDETTKEIECNSRVKRVNGNTIIMENLDYITVNLNLKNEDVYGPFETSRFYSKINENTNLELLSYSLDEITGEYSLLLRICDNYDVFSNQKIKINIETSVYFGEMFISEFFLLKDEESYYVYKYFIYKDGKYRKRINVEYLYSKGGYAIIRSDELNKGNMVMLYGE